MSTFFFLLLRMGNVTAAINKKKVPKFSLLIESAKYDET